MSRGTRVGWHRIVATSVLAFYCAIFAYLYALPLPLRAGPEAVSLGRVSVVLYIDSLGPVWQAGFGLSTLALAAGLIWHRVLAWAHTGSGAVTTTYASSLWIGFFASSPHPPPLPTAGYALATSAVALWHFQIGVAYADIIDPRRRRRVTAARSRSLTLARGGSRRHGRGRAR
jgi:hypothetical protein